MHRQSQLALRFIYSTTAKLYSLNKSKVLKTKGKPIANRQLRLVLVSRVLLSKKPISNLLTHLFVYLLSESTALDGLRKSSVLNFSSKLLLLNVPYILQKNTRYIL